MSDITRKQIAISATTQDVFAVIADVAAYPSWIDDISSVNVIERDDDGRPVLVAFEASGFGRTTSYSLRYDWSAAPDELSWSQDTADLTSRLDGSYEIDDQGGQALVTYSLAVELKIPLPTFLRRRAETKIVETALQQLKNEVLRRTRADGV